MHSSERHVTPDSDYYIYEPSTLAREVYLYPLSSGHFRYTAGYRNQRRSFDSFELFYVEDGSVELKNHSRTLTASTGQFVLLDCYSPHSYYSKEGWTCYWLHFDGHVARAFYRRIIEAYDSFIFDLDQYSPAYLNLMNIYELFRRSRPVDEAGISSHITSILNSILSGAPRIREDIPVREAVASAVARLANAKFLLRTTEDPVKDIAIRTGWGSESTFCSAFRKSTGTTPSLYRQSRLYEN